MNTGLTLLYEFVLILQMINFQYKALKDVYSNDILLI